MLAPDTVLQNRYRIVHLLGQGGMGAVYLAIDERLGHRIALKQMFHAHQETLARAFEREAKLLARLNHRCLPKVSDHFSEADSRYLVMQYVGGEDLGNLLGKNGCPFPLEQVLYWADNLLDALEYLHKHEPPILHRDIKPQNLKISPRGELFLLDFGLAKDTATSFSNPLLPPSVIGYTLSYSPLEQIERQRTTQETDIYAFCATVYHLLTNQLPAEALNRLRAKAEQLPDPLIPAHQLNPQIPVNLSAVLGHGLAMRREDRPNATRLRQLLKNPPSVAVQDSTSPNITLTLPTAGDLPLAEKTALDPSLMTSAEFSNARSASPTEPAPTKSLLQNTRADFVFLRQTAPPTAKSKRSRAPLWIGLVVLMLFGAGLATVGYYQFVATADPEPSPAPAAQNSPAPTVENASIPPANASNQNLNQTRSSQSVTPVEKRTVRETFTPKTTAPQKSGSSTQKRPVKKEGRKPPVIIPQ